MDTLIEYIKNCTPALILAAFGGFVSIVSGEKSLTVRYIIGGILLSMLTGLVLDAIIKEMGASQNIWAITISLGGYCSRKVMEILERNFLAKVKSGGADA